MARRKTRDEFIEDAKRVHGEKYDYSKVEYLNSATKVCIICPIHGEFWQTPDNHLSTQGCPICGRQLANKKKTLLLEKFIENAQKIHGDKYDYSKVEYKNNHTKVCIICPLHGEFWQIPSAHLSGRGCYECGCVKRIRKKDVSVWIEEVNIIHNEKYDYSQVNYVNNKTKVCIICPIHGEFWQTPDNHYNGQGCPKCKNDFLSQIKTNTKEYFIEKAKQTHGDKYDYSKVEYINNATKVCIICPIHGEFWQTPKIHLRGSGCAQCNGGVKYSQEEFIEKARLVHNDIYDYSKVEYINSDVKVCIICPIHGEFWQTPHSHLFGANCPICKQSHLEREIRNLLNDNNIVYEEQKRFGWLGKQSLDFYLPQYNIGIECQGKQHFEAVTAFGGEKNFKLTQLRDKIKKEKIFKHGIKLLYYTKLNNYENFLGEKLIKSEKELLENLHK